jgi:hypothetical protein
VKTPYTFVVLRYVHDVLTAEFVNIGVILYAPEAKYLDARLAKAIGRASRFFGGIELGHLKSIQRHLGGRIDQLAERLSDEIVLDRPPSDVTECVSQILPPDDSSLQVSGQGGGFTSDPQRRLEALYSQYVLKYGGPDALRRGRPDEAVLSVFRKKLSEAHLIPKLRPKKIVGKDYEHEFPISWKNGIWNASEAISLDLLNEKEILDKANRWLGRTMSLADSEETFKLFLLLGEPQSEGLRVAYTHAQNILNKMTCDHEFFGENEAGDFAEIVKQQIDTKSD